MRVTGRVFVIFLLLTLLLPVAALADTRPKPSVVIDFTGLEGETYYATLLSQREQYGPWSAQGDYQDWHGDRAAWEAFRAYEDPQGFYFLEHFTDCTETGQFSWTYYPPEVFKVLVYFPQYDSYAVTEDSYERYAFDSYYTVDASAAAETGLLPHLEKTYDFGWEILSFFARLVVTLAAEMALALAFGFRAKKQLTVIFITNLVTQGILNLLLNFVNFCFGGIVFVLNYIWMEAVVFVLEAAVYSLTLKRYAPDPARSGRPILYAFLANLASILLGLLVAKALPGIF